MKNSKFGFILIICNIIIISNISCNFFGIDQIYYESNIDGKYNADRDSWCQNYPICLQLVKEYDVKPFNETDQKTCNDKYLSFGDQSTCVGYNFLLTQMCLKLLVDPRSKIQYSNIDYHCGEYYNNNLP